MLKGSDSVDHEKFMKLALKQAQIAFDDDEIPVGAIVTNNGRVIAKGYNQMQRLNDPTAHAEMIAITAACNYLGSKYLNQCTLYVTVEPCVMCAGASRWAQISEIVFSAHDPKAGYQLLTSSKLFPPKIKIISGILENESQQLMLAFFEKLRGFN